MIKLIFAPFLMLMILSYGYLLPQMLNLIAKNWLDYQGFLIGMAGFLLLAFVLFRNQNLKWLRVFSHELTHVVFSLLFFNRIAGFNAESIGSGSVSYHGKGNFIISLTPYFFPLFTVVIILLKLISQEGLSEAFDIAIGASYMFHLTTFWGQVGTHQTDITKHGVIFSYSLIILMNIFFLALVLSMVSDGWSMFVDFLRVGWEDTFYFFEAVRDMVIKK